MRAEVEKGSRDGEKIKSIMAKGQMVPHELTVQLLVNSLIANPAKNYLIDGFPRAVDQAIYFEQNVMECQSVIFYEVSEDTLVQRCMGRGKTSGRTDETEDTLRQRFQIYNEQTKPVIEMYKQFGKVRTIDASGPVSDVYIKTKEALLPEVYFLIGPKASGKTTIGKHLAEKTNMHLMSFEHFCQQSKVHDKDDETKVFKLIHFLLETVHPRILIEDFPQN